MKLTKAILKVSPSLTIESDINPDTVDEDIAFLRTVKKMILEDEDLRMMAEVSRESSPALGPDTNETQIPTPVIPADLRQQFTTSVDFLLSSDWGKVPRIVAEIQDALKTNAINRDAKFISATLINMVKRNRIRRIKDKNTGQWAYSKN